MSYIITDTNDSFLYFQAIDLAKPESVIDFGMFLERVGAVSRNVKDKSISETLRLDGHTTSKLPKLPVYSIIYNNIYEEIPKENYELAIFLYPFEIYEKNEIEKIIDFINKNTKHVLLDKSTYDRLKNKLKQKSTRTLASENRQYCLVNI